jgi:hypothetical protein
MIALLLAAQLSAIQTPADTMGARVPPNFVTPQSNRELIQRLKPAEPCGGAGRMETSFGVPATLYRQGDRPAKLFSRWQDYPEPRGCLVEAKP